MNEKILSKIIAKKTSLYLKISMVLFILSLMLLSTAFIFVQQQYIQLRKDFVDNANTHLITITRKAGAESNITYPLTFLDEDSIKKMISKNQQSYVYSEYTIGFGISDEKDNTYFVKGIDNEIIKNLGLNEIKDNEAIINPKIAKQVTTLRIPNIDVESGGFTSNRITEIQMQLTPATTTIAPFDEFDIRPDTIFVNTQTMQKIITAMYGTTWDEFKINYNKVNSYGIELIEAINVYVDDLDEVKNVAKTLKSNSYEISYVLGAFEDLQSSLNSTYIIYGLLLAFILIITAVNTIISFRGYLFSMQKDMGIFRHYGYAKDRVYSIYKKLIVEPYIRIVGIMAGYTLIVSLILLQADFFKPFMLTLALIIAFVSVILIILLKILHTLCKKNIITLLKASKEVE